MTNKFRGNWNAIIPDPKPMSFVPAPTLLEEKEKSEREEKGQCVTNETQTVSHSLHVPRNGTRGTGAPHNIDASKSRLLRALFGGKLRRAAKYCERKEQRIHDSDRICNFPALVAAASIRKAAPLIEFMLQRNVSANVCCDHGKAALRESMFSKDIEIPKILLEYQANVNHKDEEGETAMYVACQVGFIQGAQLLLDAGAELGSRKCDGASNMTTAASFKRTNMISWLLEKGEDPNAKNKHGATPLIIATQRKCKIMVKILVSHHPTPLLNEQITGGYSALSVSILQNDFRIFRVLLKAKADINLATEKNASPLFLAVQKGNAAIVAKLIQAGADRSIRYENKYTPLQLAKSKKMHEIVTMLTL